MEQEAKRLLMDRLDRSLLNHVITLGHKDGGPSIGDAYELQDLAERHYYLKVEHEFTAAEVEALLSFADPLVVAAACWEDNGHKHSFPICELLNEIGAYQRFPMKEDTNTQSQEQLVEAVKAVLDQEMLEYRTSLLSKGKTELIEKSCEIAAIQEAYSYMTESFNYTYGEANLLLQLSNPLEYIASQCLLESDLVGKNGATLEEIVLNLQETKFLRSVQKAEADVSARSKKPSIREQIQKASQKIGCRPPQKGTSQQKDTPNL